MVMTICNSEISDHSEDGRVDARIILKLSLKGFSITMASEVTCLKQRKMSPSYVH
jgi:hypothetical protein